jgi:aminopeptidase N
VLATTGDQVSVSPDGLTRTFEARQVRDFTVTAATHYRTATRKVGATTVKVFYRAGTSGAAMLDAAANALGVLGGKLGAYPYPTFKVVQSAGAYGMESPGLVWIPTGTPSGNLRYLTTHETAHQWFYGLVGNDQSRHPFADEAAADAVTRKILGMRRASRCATGRLDRSIYSYTAACYYEIVYIQGGNLLDDVRTRMGTTVWWNALKGYVAANRYGLVTSRTLLDALDAATPVNLEPTFRVRFPGLY